MFSSLNILPAAYKRELSRMKSLILIHEILILMFTALALGGFILLAAHFILSQRFREVLLEDIPGTSKLERLNRDIRLLNKELSALEFAAKDPVSWSSIIVDLLRAAPEQISFNALQLSSAGRLEIQGNSENREKLIAFKQTLEGLPYLSAVELPLQFLAQREKIDFHISAFFDIQKIPIR